MPNFAADRIRSLFDRPGPEGLLYMPDGEAAGAKLRPGARLRNARRGPPWIVVAETLEDVVPTPWPGRLWRVRVRDAADEQPREDAGYVRAVAVDVLAEEPASTLFGAEGAAVVELLDLALVLTEDKARRLAIGRSPDAAKAYSRAWTRWIAKRSPHARHLRGDHDTTLLIPELGSPIGRGLALVHGTVFKRAGGAAVADADGDAVLTPPWDGAAQALAEAAMARGAPELLEPGERALLLAALLYAQQ